MGISAQSISTWRRQDRIDKSLPPGLSSQEHGELMAARRRILQLETELAVTRRAAELAEGASAPFRRFAVIQVMATQGFPVQVCCRVLEVSPSGY